MKRDKIAEKQYKQFKDTIENMTDREIMICTMVISAVCGIRDKDMQYGLNYGLLNVFQKQFNERFSKEENKS